jgi:hypothetical protein
MVGSALDDFDRRHRSLMGLAIIVALGTWVVAAVDRVAGSRRRRR